MKSKTVFPLSLLILFASMYFFKSVLFPCGRWETIPVFDSIRPDFPLPERTLGKLGIVKSGMSARDLIIAYRFFIGLNLNDRDRESVLEDEKIKTDPAAQKSQYEILRKLEEYEKGSFRTKAIETWKKNRVLVTGVVESIPLERDYLLHSKIGDTYQEYSRVNYHAVYTAASHLEELLQKYGPSDPYVEEWVRGQEMVFSTDRKKPRIPQPVQTPTWLKADREYQRASALFYSERFQEAAEAFSNISRDQSSAWKVWAAYLPARCWVRQAEISAAKEYQDPDISLLLKAQHYLEDLLKDPAYTSVHPAATSYVDIIRHRTEPGRMVQEALREFLQSELRDHFSFLFRRYQDAERFFLDHIPYQKDIPTEMWPRESTPEASFHRWLLIMNSDNLSHERALDWALEEWKGKKDLPWLVAVLNYLPPGHPRQEEIVAEASSFLAPSSASETLAWHIFRLKTAVLPLKERKVQIEDAIEHSPFPEWSKNFLRRERRSLAGSLEEWLRFAPLRIIGGIDTEFHSDPDLPWAFEDSVAEVFDRMSLDQLIASVRSNILPGHLRQTVAHVAWVRAALLEDWDKAGMLESYLEKTLQTSIRKELLSKEPFECRFELAAILLSFPGLNIHVESGYGRDPADIQEYCDFPYLDWWKREGLWKNGDGFTLPAFWNSTDIEKAKEEYNALTKEELAIDTFGRSVLPFAQAHRRDPRVPRALHLVVRATQRYKGLRTSLSRQVFRLLHYRYPKSPWTEITPYYY